jgi:hypothetical protein
VSTTIWSGGAAAGLYLGTGLILAFLVHTHYPDALGLREWIRVVLSRPLIFFLKQVEVRCWLFCGKKQCCYGCNAVGLRMGHADNPNVGVGEVSWRLNNSHCSASHCRRSSDALIAASARRGSMFRNSPTVFTLFVQIRARACRGCWVSFPQIH